MKKRSILVSIAAISALTLSFAACDNPTFENLLASRKHVHTYSEEWTFDSTNHWHAANCSKEDDCESATSDLAAHTLDANGECEVCDYKEEASSTPEDSTPEDSTPEDSTPEDSSPEDEPVAGTEENPIALTVPGSVTLNYTPNADNDPVWYTFTATETATLGVTLSANAVMGYGVSIEEIIYSTGNYVEVELTAGTVYYVNLSTEDFSAGEITATAEYVVEVGIGNLSGTYVGENEWTGVEELSVEILSAEDCLSGTVTFTRHDNNGNPIVENYTYEVVEGEFVFLNADGSPVNTMMSNLVVENGVPTEATSNGTLYFLSVGGGGSPVVPATGFEGTYSAVSNSGDDWTMVITSDSIEISAYFMGRPEVIGSSAYTVEDGVPVVDPDGMLSTITFTVEDGVIVSLLDSTSNTNFTVTKIAGGETPDVPETGFEGYYTAIGEMDTWSIEITSEKISISAGYYAIGTSSYTVVDGVPVVDPDGDLYTITFTVVDGVITALFDSMSDTAFDVYVKGQEPAEEGSEGNPIEIDLANLEPVYAGSEAYVGVYYTFTSTADGILTVVYPEANCYVDLYDATWTYSSYVADEAEFTLEIVGGITYTLKLGTTADLAKPPQVSLSFVEQALPQPGDFAKPHEAWTGEPFTCEFPATEDAEKYVWYSFAYYLGGDATITFGTNVNVKHGLSANALTAAVNVAEIEFSLEADVPYYFGIQTADLAEANVTFEITCIPPQGSCQDYPKMADVGTNSYTYAGGWKEIYYSYTPLFDGTVTIKAKTLRLNVYSADYEIYGEAYIDTPKTYEVKAEQTLYIVVVGEEEAVTASFELDFTRTVVPTGFEGAYTATTDVPAAMVPAYDVEFTSTDITVSFTARGTLQSNTYEYKLVDGVPTIVGDYIDYTFTVADGKLATMVDQGGIAYTIAPVIPEGKKENPIKLTFDADANGSLIVGGDTIKNDNHEGKGYTYYEITPSVSGTFTITLSATANAVVVIDNAGVTSAHFIAGTTYTVAIGVLNEANDIPTATYTFVKDAEVSGDIAIQYGTYTTTSGYTVTITETTINITYKNTFTGVNSSKVSNSEYTVDMQNQKISILSGKPAWYLVFDNTGLLTTLNDGSDRALTKTA